MSDEADNQEIPGQTEHFHEDPYVHGVARGLQETYDIGDTVYSLLVYGSEVPVTEDGTIAEEDGSAAAIFAIMPPMMPGGVPSPLTIPMLDGEDEFVIDREKENLQPGDMVAFYDGDTEQTRTGIYMPSEEEDEGELADDEVALLVGSGDDMSAVIVETGGETNEVEINGETLSGSWSMANDDDEHEKDWWRIEEIEEQIED